MPFLEFTEPHSLPRGEVSKRLKERISSEFQSYSDKIKNYKEDWVDSCASISFSVQGVTLYCDLTVKEKEVSFKMKLPWIAMMYRKKIEGTVRPVLKNILNSSGDSKVND